MLGTLHLAVDSDQRSVNLSRADHCLLNKRGGNECCFDVMGNNFGWLRLPCLFLSENTAFMTLTAITANFYRYIISLYPKSIRWLKDTFRLKKIHFPLSHLLQMNSLQILGASS
jgi:hypothetical protein